VGPIKENRGRKRGKGRGEDKEGKFRPTVFSKVGAYDTLYLGLPLLPVNQRY